MNRQKTVQRCETYLATHPGSTVADAAKALRVPLSVMYQARSYYRKKEPPKRKRSAKRNLPAKPSDIPSLPHTVVLQGAPEPAATGPLVVAFVGSPAAVVQALRELGVRQ